MNGNFYEKHGTDRECPVILHTDTLRKRGVHYDDGISDIQPIFRVHWHENLELLYMLEGECDVITNGRKIHATVGDIALVNSNMVHQVEATTEYARYECLIIDAAIMKGFGIDIEHILFERCIRDSEAERLFLEAVRCERGGGEYRLLDLKLAIFALAVNLLKNHTDGEYSTEGISNPKTETVKRAIEYMKEHYAEPITVDGLARYLGFTKYYFCHIFSEVTGSTVINHLNYIRCKNARKLILSGKCNITEAAEQSGFTNMSYFAKIYKNVIGQLPSGTKAEAKSI